MTKLQTAKLSIPFAQPRVGSLPPLKPLRYIADDIQVDDSVPIAAREYLGYGCDAPCLPYTELVCDHRDPQMTELGCVLLENENLQATILPTLGGRIWSLWDKRDNCELLHVNDQLVPTNQSVRGAWFAGGIEWNISLRGHGPFTMAPLHAEIIDWSDGTPSLRMYGFERVRGVPFSITLALPKASRFLIARSQVDNPHDKTIPMYAWTNAAVPLTPDSRIVVPATHTYRYSYAGCMSRVGLPKADGIDITRAGQLTSAADYFHEMPTMDYPWMAILQSGHESDSKSVRGLVQMSTRCLGGRKLFVWGTEGGGPRWQRFLSRAAADYCEIQAGLARTQYECTPMEANAQWVWIEAWGALPSGAIDYSSVSWSQLQQQTANSLFAQRVPALLEEAQRHPLPPLGNGQVLLGADQWGQLEVTCAELEGTQELRFPAKKERVDVSGTEDVWQTLLESCQFPSRHHGEWPGPWQAGAPWRDRLIAAIANGDDHWFAHYHVGVMFAADRHWRNAQREFRISLERTDNAWAHAAMGQIETNPMAAHAHWKAAWELLPHDIDIALALARSYLACDQIAHFFQWVESLPESTARHPRMQLSLVQAEHGCGRHHAALDRLRRLVVPADLREGETTLSELWFSIHKALGVIPCPPIPFELDFRMTMPGSENTVA